jgi:hypothetical protein
MERGRLMKKVERMRQREEELPLSDPSLSRHSPMRAAFQNKPRKLCWRRERERTGT